MMRRRALPLVLAAAALFTGCELRADDPAPPVLVLATGGTIANTRDGDRMTADDLLDALPGIEDVARIEVEQFSNERSAALTMHDWVRLAARINALFDERPELQGVVVTHGTDTMEETAYFLSLTVSDCRPVILTGAMRRPNDVAADGPANLFDAIKVAAHPSARTIGSVVVMNDEILPAREATKAHTSRVDAFTAPGVGSIGSVTVADSVQIAQRAAQGRACDAPLATVDTTTTLPRVDIVYTYQGADGTLVRAAVAAGARGLVVAAAGAGAVTPDQRDALAEAIDAGVVVVRSSRTGAGQVRVHRTEEQIADGAPAWLGAGDLNPQKARVLLMLALSRTSDPAEVARLIERF